jgi:hypothetical protein
MAADIMQTAYSRLAVEGRGSEQHTATYGLGTTLAQFQRVGDSFDLVEHEIGGLERPPMLTVPEYAAARCPQ